MTIRVGFCEALYLKHLRHISPIDEDIGYEAIVDILVMCTLWTESSVMLRLFTQQVLLFANPAVPESLGARVDDEVAST